MSPVTGLGQGGDVPSVGLSQMLRPTANPMKPLAPKNLSLPAIDGGNRLLSDLVVPWARGFDLDPGGPGQHADLCGVCGWAQDHVSYTADKATSGRANGLVMAALVRGVALLGVGGLSGWLEEDVQRFSRRGATRGGVGRQQQVGVCADGQLVDIQGEGAWYRVVEGPGHRAESVHRVACPPGTEVRIAYAQLAYQCD
jgi:hypothetical protein